ncbi:MAG: FGGY-family carbohydrate kinase [Planctomycetota bacterium]
MSPSGHIAVDLGAESGRVMLGVLDGDRVTLHECHRFAHAPHTTAEGLCWDLDGIWREVQVGLRAAGDRARAVDCQLRSVGVDSWAVDYALLGRDGEILEAPRCYRDPAFPAACNAVLARLGRDRIYRATGIQILPFNTLYQYAARAAAAPHRYTADAELAFVPDLLHFRLCGSRGTELTNASTSQLLDVRTGRWCTELLSELGLPVVHFRPPVTGGKKVPGTLAPGLPAGVQCVLPPTHDTAAAVAAVPAEPGTRWCYLSSGTWSLLGAELAEPCITDAAAAANFTNELGVAGTVRFLKNISGLWLVQRLRAAFARAGVDADYEALTTEAAAATALATLMPVDDTRFTAADDLPAAIAAFARATGQPVPATRGALVRCCLDSLALQYRVTLDDLERVLGRGFDVVHVVGGGSKNLLLDELTAAATGRTVIAGPDEATALGNVLVQAMGLGLVADLAALRAIVRRSVPTQRFPGAPTPAWEGPRTLPRPARRRRCGRLSRPQGARRAGGIRGARPPHRRAPAPRRTVSCARAPGARCGRRAPWAPRRSSPRCAHPPPRTRRSRRRRRSPGRARSPHRRTRHRHRRRTAASPGARRNRGRAPRALRAGGNRRRGGAARRRAPSGSWRRSHRAASARRPCPS